MEDERRPLQSWWPPEGMPGIRRPGHYVQTDYDDFTRSPRWWRVLGNLSDDHYVVAPDTCRYPEGGSLSEGEQFPDDHRGIVWKKEIVASVRVLGRPHP